MDIGGEAAGIGGGKADDVDADGDDVILFCDKVVSSESSDSISLSSPSASSLSLKSGSSHTMVFSSFSDFTVVTLVLPIVATLTFSKIK